MSSLSCPGLCEALGQAFLIWTPNGSGRGEGGASGASTFTGAAIASLLSLVVTSLATTAAESIVSRLLSEDSVGTSELPVSDITPYAV